MAIQADTTRVVSGRVFLAGGGILVSNKVDANGERIWEPAITGAGINASLINVGVLNASNINIYSGDYQRFKWLSEGLFAYDKNDDLTPNFNKWVRFNEEGILFREPVGETLVDRVSLDWEGLSIRDNTNTKVFWTDTEGNLNLTGTITANAGMIGGWSVSSTEIYKGSGATKISLNSSTPKITIGVGNYNNSDTSFYVDANGQFSLKNKLTFNGTTLTVNGTIQSASGYFGSSSNGISIGASGLSIIGTGTITSGKVIIKNDRIIVNNASDVLQVILGYNGSEYGLFAGDAKLTASGLTINGSSSSININSGAFIVTAAGALTATSATITGTIKATDGYIGGTASGWDITNTGILQSSGGTAKIVLDAINAKIYIGTGMYGNDNTSFYADGTSQFSLGSKLTYNSGILTVNGVINATSGNFLNTITIGSHTTKLNITGTAAANTTAIYSTGASYGVSGIWLDASGRLSLGTGLTFNGTSLSISGSIKATSGYIGGTTNGWSINSGYLQSVGGTAKITLDGANGKIYLGTGTYNNDNTPFYVDGSSNFSLGSKLTYNGSDLSLIGSMQSSNFASGINGWRIDGTGNAEFENITARGALKSTVFIYDEINAQGGSLIIAESASLYSDTVKANAASTLTFSIKNSYSGQPYLFSIGDTLVIKTYINTTTKIVLWLKITAQGAQTAGYTTYTANVLSSSPTTAYTIPGGTAIVNYGVNGGGFIVLRADDTYGPYMDVVLNTSANVHLGDQVVKARLGNLSGITDAVFGSLSGYGLYSENAYLTGTLALPAAGMTNYTTVGDDIRIWAGGTYSDVINNPSAIKYKVYESGKVIIGSGSNPSMTFDPTNNSIIFGSNVSISFSSVIDAPKNYQIIINGNDIASGATSTTLSVQVLEDGVDITAIIDGSKISWYIGDTLKGTGKTMEIGAAEVNVSAQIKCIYNP